MIEYAWINESGRVIGVHPYEAPLHVLNIKKLSDGLPRQRPISGSEAAPEAWQEVVEALYIVGPDEVIRTWSYKDRPLLEVQNERLLELDGVLFALQLEGFLFENDAFALNDHATKRYDLVEDQIAGSFGVINTRQQLITYPMQKKNPFLQANNDRHYAIYHAHDIHVDAIRKTQTPQEAAEYDLSTGWPPHVNPHFPSRSTRDACV